MIWEKSWSLLDLFMNIEQNWASQQIIHKQSLSLYKLIGVVLHNSPRFSCGHLGKLNVHCCWSLKTLILNALVLFHNFCFIELFGLRYSWSWDIVMDRKTGKIATEKKMLGRINIKGVKTLSEVLAQSVPIIYSVRDVHKY